MSAEKVLNVVDERCTQPLEVTLGLFQLMIKRFVVFAFKIAVSLFIMQANCNFMMKH